jgi:2-methylcitrate dehydratase PrpD
MLAYGKLGIEHLSYESILDPRIQSEMAKIEMRRVDSLQDANIPECSRITLVTSEGREITDFLGEPTGMPGNPMTDEQLHQKFAHCASFGGLSPDHSTKLIEHLMEIESKRSAIPE